MLKQEKWKLYLAWSWFECQKRCNKSFFLNNNKKLLLHKIIETSSIFSIIYLFLASSAAPSPTIKQPPIFILLKLWVNFYPTLLSLLSDSKVLCSLQSVQCDLAVPEAYLKAALEIRAVSVLLCVTGVPVICGSVGHGQVSSLLINEINSVFRLWLDGRRDEMSSPAATWYSWSLMMCDAAPPTRQWRTICGSARQWDADLLQFDVCAKSISFCKVSFSVKTFLCRLRLSGCHCKVSVMTYYLTPNLI